MNKRTELIKNCYINSFGIDLKKIHREFSTYSEIHSIDGRQLNIADLDLEKYPLDFSDSYSTSFELEEHEHKNFLVGDNSCYPCSRVYQNVNGYRWVEVMIIPEGTEINIGNTSSSIRYHFTTLRLYETNNNKNDLLDFDKIYSNTFKKNNWFSLLERIQIIKRSNAKPVEIFEVLKELELLNPFQLTLFSITNGFELDKNNILSSLFKNNQLQLCIDYITSPSFKMKISESTIQLVEKDAFKSFIDSLSPKEIHQFFEWDFLLASINLNNLYDDFELDILGIKNIERWMQNGPTSPISTYYQNRLSKVCITEKLIREYYKRLKSNFRYLENKIRLKKGFNAVGSLYNESLLYKIIAEAFPNYKIISQYSPAWLGRQRIDIFIQEINLAIEYNGLQHYEPVSFYGGKKGFGETLRRDRLKRKKCKQNQCALIEVKFDQNLYSVIPLIKELAALKTKCNNGSCEKP